MGKQKYSLIHIEKCQIKSHNKLILFCKLIDKLEKEFGIKEVEISFKNNYICPDINLQLFADSEKPMESLIGKLFIKTNILKYNKKSKYRSSLRNRSRN